MEGDVVGGGVVRHVAVNAMAGYEVGVGGAFVDSNSDKLREQSWSDVGNMSVQTSCPYIL